MVKRLLIFVLWLPWSLWGSHLLTQAHVEGDRLILTFAKPFSARDVHVFHIDAPRRYRYVLDLYHTRMASSRVPEGLHHRQVRSFRISQYRPDRVRVVIETSKPYSPTKRLLTSTRYAWSLPHRAKPTLSSLFSDFHTSKGHPASAKRSYSPAKNSSASSPFPSISDVMNRTSSSVSHTVLKHHYTVLIDPGHGGHDSGAVAGGRREKDAVLQIAKRLRGHLLSMGFRVIMTRSTDCFIPLGQRTRFANKNHGDVFVSIHANSVSSRRKRRRHGVETFFLQTTRSGRAKRVAARENSVVLNRSDRLSKNVILNAVMTGPKIVLSNKLAIDVQRHILGNLRRNYRDVKDGGVRPAPFWVLVGAEMPAVLVETGYISNPMERRRLFTPRYQDRLAKGIAEGIAVYLSNREKEME